jgi:hypothetical protein
MDTSVAVGRHTSQMAEASESTLRQARHAWWFSSLSDLRSTDSEQLLQHLTSRAIQNGLDVTAQQRSAWRMTKQVLDLLFDTITDDGKMNWWVALEFDIPRVAKRIDVVLLTSHVIAVIEFKTGESQSQRAAEFQVSDYATNLRHLHSTSANNPVIPIVVVASPNPARTPLRVLSHKDTTVWVESHDRLAPLVQRIFEDLGQVGVPITPQEWIEGYFQRTPGILEVVRHVASKHDVLELRHYAGDDVEVALQRVREIIVAARTQHHHVLCFVSGVPGAGKTFLGLGATQGDSSSPDLTGTYLSGNGPLVKVVTYALELDHRRRMGDRTAAVKAFVQPVHAFIDGEFTRGEAPSEHVIVFDEAQRAWSAGAMAKFHEGEITCSEADAAVQIMGRHKDWAVIVALIGSGQEIDRGEAGIEAWLTAGLAHSKWKVVGPNNLLSQQPELVGRAAIDPALNLSVGIRSPHSLAVTSWIEALLSGQFAESAKVAASQPDFPIVATRDLDVMRSYLRDRARTDCRVGLVAPSKDRRLRAFGIERATRFLKGINFAHWFVHDQTDVRSSYSLEVAASEFDCQGLELDWIGLCWGGDLYWDGEWKSQKFEGKQWKKETNPTIAINRYRVLLSRARQGMVIWVPNDVDHRHLEIPRSKLDTTWEILMAAGVTAL